ncbi:MAG TPA: malonyl-ACP O-methyltransferase, partial [Burkholderiales bacterium]|nr:malonyl-ACP O-methyltransferase [Burkholderiales bacterium]
TGNAIAGLAAHYPRARLIALDLALAMVRRARARLPWWRRWFVRRGARLAAVCGDIEALPLAGASADMVWSNLSLQWVNEPRRAFAEFARVLRPGGLLMFSSFGPDTLKELRAAWEGLDRHTHVHRFLDMHDLGDMLVACGYADPVMDMEMVTLSYADVRELMRELKAIGARNLTRGRPGALTGKALLEQVARNYEAFRREGRLPATFEIVYGHAWKPHPRLGPSGRPVIEIRPR